MPLQGNIIELIYEYQSLILWPADVNNMTIVESRVTCIGWRQLQLLLRHYCSDLLSRTKILDSETRRYYHAVSDFFYIKEEEISWLHVCLLFLPKSGSYVLSSVHEDYYEVFSRSYLHIWRSCEAWASTHVMEELVLFAFIATLNPLVVGQFFWNALLIVAMFTSCSEFGKDIDDSGVQKFRWLHINLKRGLALEKIFDSAIEFVDESEEFKINLLKNTLPNDPAFSEIIARIPHLSIRFTHLISTVKSVAKNI